MFGNVIAFFLSQSFLCASVRVQPELSIPGQNAKDASGFSMSWFNSFMESDIGDAQNCKEFLMKLKIECRGMPLFCTMWKFYRKRADFSHAPNCGPSDLDDWCGGGWKNVTDCSAQKVIDEDNACEKMLLEKMSCWNKPSFCQRADFDTMQPSWVAAKISPSCQIDHLKGWCSGGLNAIEDCDKDVLDHMDCHEFIVASSRHVKHTRTENQQWCKFLIELNLDQYDRKALRHMSVEEFEKKFGPNNPEDLLSEGKLSEDEVEDEVAAKARQLLQFLESEGISAWFGSRAAHKGCTQKAMTSMCHAQGAIPDDSTIVYPLAQKWTDDIRQRLLVEDTPSAEK